MGNSNIFKYFFAGVIVLAMIALFSVLYLYFFENPTKSSVIEQPKLPVESTRNSLLSHNQFLLPDTVRTGASQVVLPEDLKFFIIDPAGDISIISASYPNDKNGYQVEMSGNGYTLRSIMGFYLKFDQQDGWKVSKSAYIDRLGYVNMENSKYYLQTISEELPQGKYSISMKIIQK